jgi:hypothetical protein
VWESYPGKGLIELHSERVTGLLSLLATICMASSQGVLYMRPRDVSISVWYERHGKYHSKSKYHSNLVINYWTRDHFLPRMRGSPTKLESSSKTECGKKGELCDGGAGQEKVTKRIECGSGSGEDAYGNAMRFDAL